MVFFEHRSVFSTPAVFFQEFALVFSQHRNGVFPASERCFFSSAVFSPHRKRERERDGEKRDRERKKRTSRDRDDKEVET